MENATPPNINVGFPSLQNSDEPQFNSTTHALANSLGCRFLPAIRVETLGLFSFVLLPITPAGRRGNRASNHTLSLGCSETPVYSPVAVIPGSGWAYDPSKRLLGL